MSPLSILSPLCALLFAPFLFGVIAKTKAFFAGRNGPPLLQVYFDLFKLIRKGAVFSTTTSFVFAISPSIALGSITLATFLFPLGSIGAPLSFTGDILFFVFLFAIARFFTIIAALDTGSAFEGMGASREAFFSALTEPVFLLCLLSLCGSAPSFSLIEVAGAAGGFPVAISLLAGAGLFVVLLAENARIPVDDPATHLELTMIHEVMVLDNSGPDFAFITYTAALKYWLCAALLVRVLMPFHPASPFLQAALTLVGMSVVAIITGCVESIMARLRLIHVPQLLTAAAALGVLALIASKEVL